MSWGALPGSTANKAFGLPLPSARPPGAGGGGGGGRGKLGVVRVGPARAAVENGGRVGMTFYELLGIPAGGSAEEIKRAYKQLARRYHPDVSPPERAEEHTRLFIEVQEAYETLSDPDRRAFYDLQLARGLHLAISSRQRFDEVLDEKARWKIRWQEQLAGLNRRTPKKDSWATQMRRQNSESSTD